MQLAGVIHLFEVDQDFKAQDERFLVVRSVEHQTFQRGERLVFLQIDLMNECLPLVEVRAVTVLRDGLVRQRQRGIVIVRGVEMRQQRIVVLFGVETDFLDLHVARVALEQAAEVLVLAFVTGLIHKVICGKVKS